MSTLVSDWSTITHVILKSSSGTTLLSDPVIMYNGIQQWPVRTKLAINKEDISLTVYGRWEYAYVQSNYSSYVNISGTVISYTPGTFTVTITPKPAYTWADGTTDSIDITWEAVAEILTINIKPSITASMKTYNFTVFSATSPTADWVDMIDNLSGMDEYFSYGTEVFYKYNDTWYALYTSSGVVSCSDVVINNSTYYCYDINKTVDPTQFTYLCNQTYTYDGAAIILSFLGTGFSTTYTAQTNAGTYTFTVTLSSGYIWSDTGSTEDRSFSYTIQRFTLLANKPTLYSRTYTGNFQTLIDYNALYYSEDDNISADAIFTVNPTSTSYMNAGSYSFTVTPTSNAKWPDGTTSAKTFVTSIAKASIAKPTINSSKRTYDGEYYTWLTLPTGCTYTGSSLTAYDAGTYTAYVTPDSNHVWSDGTTSTLVYTFVMSKRYVTKPYLTGDSSFVYNGSTRYAITIPSDTSAYIASSGNTSAATAGSYKATFSLEDTSNTCWADGTTSSFSLSWSISKLVFSWTNIKVQGAAANSSGNMRMFIVSNDHGYSSTFSTYRKSIKYIASTSQGTSGPYTANATYNMYGNAGNIYMIECTYSVAKTSTKSTAYKFDIWFTGNGNSTNITLPSNTVTTNAFKPIALYNSSTTTWTQVY